MASQLSKISKGSSILDAGCGEQQYKSYCQHLIYKAQDFGKFISDEKDGFAASSEKWNYGHLDYIGDIWNIPEKDSTFDAILCTEVLEHIPYPGETILEFSRLLKKGGVLILTVPSNCLRHQDPYFFSSGYSDHFLTYWLDKSGFSNYTIAAQGDYFQWMACELYRTFRRSGIFGKLIILPSLLYFLILQLRPTTSSKATLCKGYHVVAYL